jgi:hypothetical protein
MSLGPQCLGPQCLLKGLGPQCPDLNVWDLNVRDLIVIAPLSVKRQWQSRPWQFYFKQYWHCWQWQSTRPIQKSKYSQHPKSGLSSFCMAIFRMLFGGSFKNRTGPFKTASLNRFGIKHFYDCFITVLASLNHSKTGPFDNQTGPVFGGLLYIFRRVKF